MTDIYEIIFLFVCGFAGGFAGYVTLRLRLKNPHDNSRHKAIIKGLELLVAMLIQDIEEYEKREEKKKDQ